MTMSRLWRTHLLLVLPCMALLCALPAQGAPIILGISNSGGGTIGSNLQSFGRGDLVLYDPATDTASLYFDEDGPSGFHRDGGNGETITAVHRVDGDSVLLSHQRRNYIGGIAGGPNELSNDPHDVFEIDQGANLATRVFSGRNQVFPPSIPNGFAANENVNGVSRAPNGNLIITTTDGAILGGLGFSQDDLVEVDLVAQTVSLYFDGTPGQPDGRGFLAAERIDAAHVMPSGNIVLSTDNTATLGGLTFERGDLIEYDPSTNMATMLLQGSSVFRDASGDVGAVLDIESVWVAPEPTSLLLLALGVGLIRRRRRQTA